MSDLSKRLSPADLEAFATLVKKEEGPSGHWIWLGKLREGGVADGEPWFAVRFPGGHGAAARFCWEIETGEVLGGKRIHRVCDEPLCIRPEHHRTGQARKERVAKNQRTRAKRMAFSDPYTAELLRLYKRSDDHNREHDAAVARIASTMEAMAKDEAEWHERIGLELSAIEEELRRIAKPAGVVAARSPYDAAQPKPPTSLAAAFERALDLRVGSVIDASPLTEALHIAIRLAKDNSHDGALLFASWLTSYKEAKPPAATPCPSSFLAYVKSIT